MDGINQGHLVKALEVIFPAHKNIINARKHTNLTYPNGAYLELDAWIPQLKLGFEFQDDYHYVTTWYVQKSKDKIHSKDYIKRFILHQNGICLIDVPCWWDGTVASLAGTITFCRNDLSLPFCGAPISLVPPFGFFPAPDIPGVGELMLASFPMDSKANTLSISENTWWLGEKFDGIRCCWNPVNKCVFTRRGNEVDIIPSLIAYLPPIFVDGEFWFGRGQYTNTYVLLKGFKENVYWQFLRMMTFDNPTVTLQRKPFEERYATLLETIPMDHLFTIIVMRVLCSNTSQVNEMTEGILDDGGEGVILRKIGSKYEHGRTSDLIKLKTSFGDKEGIVVAVLNNRSVRLKLPNGETFDVPEDSVLVKVKIGEIVSFSYECHSRRDVPVNPKIYRVRGDLVWEDVVYNAGKEKAFLSDPSRMAEFKAKPLGHWTKKTMRNFMEKFAKLWKMDPLVPDTWYRLQFQNIRKYKGGMAIVQKFKGYVNAVRSLFPDVAFDNQAFLLSSWSDIRNRRKFFENFALKHRFDPLKPANWYKQTKEKVKTTKGAYGVLSYHKFSVSKALIDLFPNIGLEKSRFHAKNAWHEANNRRRFFEDYARSVNFDPLNADKWYSQYSTLTSVKGIYSVIQHHGYSISKSLISLFPDVNFDKSKFQTKSWVNKNGLLWHIAEDRRKFFEEYALSRKFDPLIAENWYSEPRERILATTGAFRVIHHHNRSLAQALSDLFPEIGVDKSKFLYHVSWNKKERRRKFFEDYAKVHAFNPLVPSQWYSHPVEKLLAEKGLASITHYHNKSVITALTDLFPEIGLDREKLKTWRLKKSVPQSLGTENQRKFFENYAKQNKFDPLLPENWYLQKKQHIMEIKGASTIIKQHGKSLSQTLLEIFPDIGLKRAKFSWVTSTWANKHNRREFFTKYAEVNGFDPRDPAQWYSQTREKILAVKGASRVLYYHCNSLAHALLDLFPDIGLDKSRLFGKAKLNENVRKFFVEYADSRSFDPLVPENWYSEPLDRIKSAKGALEILAPFGGSVVRALRNALQDLGLEKTKFASISEWDDATKRRNLFERFAKENNFDPLDPNAWYLQQKEQLLGTQGISKVVALHGSLARALVDLFPNIGLDVTKLWPKKTTFSDPKIRRKFLEKYAQSNSFDPLVPENWYSQSFEKFLAVSGAHRVIFYHKNRVSEAIADLFPEIGLDKTKIRADCMSYPPIFR